MNQPHLDDDLLSAALDGEPDPNAVSHLGACDACLARLDALDRVRQQVAAVPAPAPAGVADRAVAAATAAWRDERGPAAAAPSRRGATRTRPAEANVDDDIVPLRRRPAKPAGAAAGAGAPRRRAPGWALGAAAAVVAALLAVPFLVGDDSDEKTASAPTGGTADEASSLDAGAVDGGALGSLSDAGTLREELLRSVPGAGAAADARAGEAAPSSEDSLAAPAAAPSTSFAGGTTAAAQRSPAGEGGAAGDVPCREEIRAQVGDRLGPLLYTAGLRWQDTDAVVLAYRLADTSGAGPDHLAFVTARDDCRVLTSQGF